MRPQSVRVPPIGPLSFFFYSSAAHRDLHSFPTRRSSDLPVPGDTPSSFAERAAGLPERRLVELAAYAPQWARDRKSTRLNSSHSQISYAVFCLKKKNK